MDTKHPLKSSTIWGIIGMLFFTYASPWLEAHGWSFVPEDWDAVVNSVGTIISAGVAARGRFKATQPLAVKKPPNDIVGLVFLVALCIPHFGCEYVEAFHASPEGKRIEKQVATAIITTALNQLGVDDGGFIPLIVESIPFQRAQTAEELAAAIKSQIALSPASPAEQDRALAAIRDALTPPSDGPPAAGPDDAAVRAYCAAVAANLSRSRG